MICTAATVVSFVAAAGNDGGAVLLHVLIVLGFGSDRSGGKCCLLELPGCQEVATAEAGGEADTQSDGEPFKIEQACQVHCVSLAVQ